MAKGDRCHSPPKVTLELKAGIQQSDRAQQISFSCPQKNPIHMYRVLLSPKRNYKNALETILQSHQIGYAHLQFHSLLPFSERHCSLMEVHRNTIRYLLVIHVCLGIDQSLPGE